MALGQHDGADRVVEVQVLAADQPRDVGRQRFGGQRAGRDNHRLAVGRVRQRQHFLAHDRDEGMLVDSLVIVSAKRSRSTARAAPAGTRLASAARMTSDPSRRISSLSKPDGVIELVAAEGVAADELGEPIRLVHRRRPHRPHLVQRHRHAADATCQAASNRPGRRRHHDAQLSTLNSELST